VQGFVADIVVDDSSIIRQMVCKSLGLAGLPPHEISEACDGAGTVYAARGITQIRLGTSRYPYANMTGTQLVGAMSEDEELKRIPVVIISSDGNTANHERLRALGVRALLRKPFRPEQFRAVVHLFER